MIYSLDEAILNVGSGANNIHSTPEQNKILYSPWETDYAETIQEFYDDFVADRLPDPMVVEKWHKLLVAYSEYPKAVFPVRIGNVKNQLRRGWLVRVDNDFSYMFTDNDLATYIYKMALDGYCPEEKEFFEFMTEFKDPSKIGWVGGRSKKIRSHTHRGQERQFISMPAHFNHIGGKTYPDNTEAVKNAYINYSPAPTCCLGRNGYKHAHLIDVNKAEYEGCSPWQDVRNSLLGEESNLHQDYQWDPTVRNFIWKRTGLSQNEKASLKKILVAHMFRFLDPLNHFLAPKRENNQYTDSSGSVVTDIAEYPNLQAYIIAKKAEVFPSIYTDFLIKARAPISMRSLDGDRFGDEKIDLHYSRSKKAAKPKTAKPKATKPKAATSSAGKTRAASGDNKKIVFDIFNDVIHSGKMTPKLLADLQTLSFATKQFGMSGYPILVAETDIGSHPHYNKKKYYQTETLTIHAATYYVCSQWTPNIRLVRLQDWHKTL